MLTSIFSNFTFMNPWGEGFFTKGKSARGENQHEFSGCFNQTQLPSLEDPMVKLKFRFLRHITEIVF